MVLQRSGTDNTAASPDWGLLGWPLERSAAGTLVEIVEELVAGILAAAAVAAAVVAAAGI